MVEDDRSNSQAFERQCARPVTNCCQAVAIIENYLVNKQVELTGDNINDAT